MAEKLINQQDEYIAAERDQVIDPLGDGISTIQIVRISGSDLDVVNAARVSYGKVSTQISERDQKLINFLIEHDHTSPFEHNQLSFRIKAPIFVVRQWMRHRMNSYNEISYRYVKAPVEFYVPPFWRKQDSANKQSSIEEFQDESLRAAYLASIETSYKAYEQLLQAGVGRELARGLLPLCTYTEFIYTCNLHSLMHFIRLRTHKGAQAEIRAYAHALLKIAREYFPASIAAFEKKLQGAEQLQSEVAQLEHPKNFTQLLTNN